MKLSTFGIVAVLKIFQKEGFWMWNWGISDPWPLLVTFMGLREVCSKQTFSDSFAGQALQLKACGWWSPMHSLTPVAQAMGVCLKCISRSTRVQGDLMGNSVKGAKGWTWPRWASREEGEGRTWAGWVVPGALPYHITPFSVPSLRAPFVFRWRMWVCHPIVT